MFFLATEIILSMLYSHSRKNQNQEANINTPSNSFW